MSLIDQLTQLITIWHVTASKLETVVFFSRFSNTTCELIKPN